MAGKKKVGEGSTERAKLEESLAAIDALLAKKRPRAHGAMKAGASEEGLDALAKAIGARVPDDVATFFRWHDGQSKIASLRGDDNRTPMSIATAIEAWTFLSDPTEDVLQPWKKSWLPLFENGAGDHLCFDLEGGSLVEYWHADEDRKVAYASLAAWVEDTIAALEKEKDAPPPAAKGPKVTLDASGATWTKVKKALTESQAAKKPIGTFLWYRKKLFDGGEPVLQGYLRVDAKGEKPWRKVQSKEPDVGSAIARLQGYFDGNFGRGKARPVEWWSATDWDVGYACKEEVFSKEDPAPDGMFEGMIQIREG